MNMVAYDMVYGVREEERGTRVITKEVGRGFHHPASEVLRPGITARLACWPSTLEMFRCRAQHLQSTQA